MAQNDLWSLVGLIGLLVQFGASMTLWLFFFLLRQHAGRRSRFFSFWTWGWVALSAALVFVAVGLYGEGPVQKLGLLFYQGAKLGFFLLLLAGVLEYADGGLSRRFLAQGAAVVLVCTFASIPLAGALQGIALLQGAIGAAALGYAALRLYRLPPLRRTLGAQVTIACLVAYVLLRAAHVFNLYAGPAVLGAIYAQVEHFNGYLDALLELLLACGMVLMLLEDARRETNAAHAELAVAHEKLLHDSLTDPLTGVYNRLAFTRGIFLKSAGSTFGSVFIFDLDNLKLVNDSHGHEAGDQLLRYFVTTLRGGLRPADQVYRWGGDEFLLLLPGATFAGVAPRLNALWREAPPFLFSDKQIPLALEVSSGGADYSDLESLRAAVNHADRAMYREKRSHKTGPSSLEEGMEDAPT